jgi:hypothetical protein
MRLPLTLASAALLVVATASWAAAQPTAQQPVKLRGVGPPDARRPSLGQSRIVLWAGQLELTVRGFRDEVRSLPLAGTARIALALQTDRALKAADEFHATARRVSDPARLAAEHAAVDAALHAMATTAKQFATVYPSIAASLARVEYADERLHAALGSDTGDTERRVKAVRLAKALTNQAEQLRQLVEGATGGRGNARGLQEFIRGSRQLSGTLDGGRPLAQARQEYVVLAGQWKSTGREIEQMVADRPAVRVQAARVEGIVRDLGRVLGAEASDPIFGIVPQAGRGFVVGAGEGGGPHVRVFHDFRSGAAAEFFAYDPQFRGGVRVAIADLTGDGYPEVVTAPGKGMPPLVRVFDGRDLQLVTEFLAFDSGFDLGVFVAAADLTRTGKAVVAVGTGTGATPHVRIFDLAQGKELESFFPHPKELRCGVRVALGDVDGDGLPDLVTAPGAGNGPHVQVWSGVGLKKLSEFNFVDPTLWTGGVFIATADVTRNGRAEVVVGADAGGGPVVRVFDGLRGRLIGELTPYPEAFRGGVRVAGYDANGDGVMDLVCAPGPGEVSAVKVYDGKNRRLLHEFTPYGPAFTGGAYVAGR